MHLIAVVGFGPKLFGICIFKKKGCDVSYTLLKGVYRTHQVVGWLVIVTKCLFWRYSLQQFFTDCHKTLYSLSVLLQKCNTCLLMVHILQSYVPLNTYHWLWLQFEIFFCGRDQASLTILFTWIQVKFYAHDHLEKQICIISMPVVKGRQFNQKMYSVKCTLRQTQAFITVCEFVVSYYNIWFEMKLISRIFPIHDHIYTVWVLVIHSNYSSSCYKCLILHCNFLKPSHFC